jgi:hypothetical protein
MKKQCLSKGGEIAGTGVIVWNKHKEEKITEVVQNFVNLF